MKRLTFLLFFTVVMLISAAGDDFEVVYLDGTLEIETPSGRRSAGIGTTIPEDGTVYLGENSLAELVSPATTLLLSKGGVHRLENVTEKKGSIRKSPADSLFQRFARIGGQGDESQSAVMGVRGSEANDNLSFDWVEEDTLSYEEALSAYDSRDYELAATILQEEVDPSLLEDETDYWYHLASALLFAGQSGKAMKITSDHPGEKSSLRYEDYLLLRGRLFLESLDFAAAALQYDTYLELVTAPADRQLGYYFYGFSLLQNGELDAGRRAIRQAADIDAVPEITQAARELGGN
jgi:hypothetical protein